MFSLTEGFWLIFTGAAACPAAIAARRPQWAHYARALSGYSTALGAGALLLGIVGLTRVLFLFLYVFVQPVAYAVAAVGALAAIGLGTIFTYSLWFGHVPRKHQTKLGVLKLRLSANEHWLGVIAVVIGIVIVVTNFIPFLHL